MFRIQCCTAYILFCIFIFSLFFGSQLIIIFFLIVYCMMYIFILIRLCTVWKVSIFVHIMLLNMVKIKMFPNICGHLSFGQTAIFNIKNISIPPSVHIPHCRGVFNIKQHFIRTLMTSVVQWMSSGFVHLN